MKRRWTVYGVLAAVAVGMLASVAPASASSTGRRNTALALAGIAAYELLHGKTGPGLIAGAGAAYAWKRANDAQRAEERDRYYGYYDPYYTGGYYGGYSQGYYGRDARRYDRDGRAWRRESNRRHGSWPDWQRGDRDWDDR